MRFTYNGTLEELVTEIHSKAKAYSKDIIVHEEDPNMLKIGFQRLGHSGGRCFVANVTETDTAVFLQGELIDIYSDKPESNVRRFWNLLGAFAMFYILIELVLQIIWLPIFHIFENSIMVQIITEGYQQNAESRQGTLKMPQKAA